MGKMVRAAHILMVDDDLLVAVTLESFLRDFGFEDIDVAADLPAAMALISERPPSLAILDVNVGHFTVFPLAGQLDAMAIPIIFSTGGPLDQIPSTWSSRPIIRKPFSKTTLLLALQSAGFMPLDAVPGSIDGRSLGEAPDDPIEPAS